MDSLPGSMILTDTIHLNPSDKSSHKDTRGAGDQVFDGQSNFSIWLGSAEVQE